MNTCQKILCSVSSCDFNKKGDNQCTLEAIQVSPSATSSSGAPYDETLCASYKHKHSKK